MGVVDALAAAVDYTGLLAVRVPHRMVCSNRARGVGRGGVLINISSVPSSVGEHWVDEAALFWKSRERGGRQVSCTAGQ